MAPTCSTCNQPLAHVTGHAVIRLYRCGKCGTQAMLPGDPNAPIETAAAPAVAVEGSPAAAPPAKKGFFAKLFGG